jgi:hypothetical protein
MTSRSLALVLAVALGSASCSFIAMRRPPDPPQPHVPPNCTSSRIPPVVDLVLGIPYLAAGLVIVMIASNEDEDSFFDQDEIMTMGVMTAAFGGVMTWSGFTGLDIANDCSHAETLYEDYINSPAARQPMIQPQPQIRPGYEGGACGWQNWCAPGLTCASNHCVRLPPPYPAPPPPQP